MSGAIELQAIDLVVAALLVVAAGLVSVALSLNLERRLAIASLRTVLQLLLVGYVLKWIFAVNHPGWVLLYLAFMIAAAAFSAVRRSSRTFTGAIGQALFTLAISATLTTFIVTATVLQVDPWFAPRYVLPLAGMILGNSLTGISLCLDSLLQSLSASRAFIEEDLALGATRWEAAREPLREAVRRGMIPIINSMMVVGIVSLPGMMTGQILAGADPMEAVLYQIVVMFMIAAATSLGCVGIAMLAYRRLLNRRHQLLFERIREQRT